MSRVLSCVTLTSVLVCGCTADPGANQQGADAIPQWEELDQLGSQDLMYPMEMGASMGDWSSVRTAAEAPELKSAVDAFEAKEIPSEFATEARQQAKDETVSNFRALIEAADGGTDAEVQAAWEAAKESYSAVRA